MLRTDALTLAAADAVRRSRFAGNVAVIVVFHSPALVIDAYGIDKAENIGYRYTHRAAVTAVSARGTANGGLAVHYMLNVLYDLLLVI